MRVGVASALFVWPAVGPTQQSAQVIDFACMIKVVGNHDTDDDASGQAIAPVGETIAVQFSIVGQGADGGQPAAMAVGEPGEEFGTGT